MREAAQKFAEQFAKSGISKETFQFYDEYGHKYEIVISKKPDLKKIYEDYGTRISTTAAGQICPKCGGAGVI